jgi:hypothetical protein
MEAIFVDTSAWDAIEDSSDRHHAAALRFTEELVQQRARLDVTNFILDECYTLLLYNAGYARTVACKRAMDLNGSTKIRSGLLRIAPPRWSWKPSGSDRCSRLTTISTRWGSSVTPAPGRKPEEARDMRYPSC